MNIAIIGLGYVGCVSAACLASAGHCITGVDVNPLKVELINQGRSPIVEKEVDRLVADAVANGRLSATTDVNAAIARSELSLICVGTPSMTNGSLDLSYVRKAVTAVGHALRARRGYHVIAIRSTMLPGSLEGVILPLLENASGKAVGVDWGLCINPEFLREGTAVADYQTPPFTLIGGWDQRSSAALAAAYKEVDAPLLQTDIRVAEMVKYTCNVFHALKVGFANEVGVLCKKLDIDSHKVMEIFKQDTHLNISPSYLTPGFAFGGSCLPKDLRAVMHKAKELDLALPILEGILPSNERQIERAFQLVQATGSKKVGILGLSFKAGTDDLRESPLVHLAERLLGKGYDVRIYDHNVALARIMGANKEYIEQVIPHISNLLVNQLDHLLQHAEVVVIGNRAPEFSRLREQINDRHQIIDLVRLKEDFSALNGRYQGICW
ncbi:MAG: nucleotide sugar dehydrogenase [Caldilinea sp. CFX5]|nr:nucleotide sugar dehydrogenase [Caldilinea sp. CFX5]